MPRTASGQKVNSSNYYKVKRSFNVSKLKFGFFQAPSFCGTNTIIATPGKK